MYRQCTSVLGVSYSPNFEKVGSILVSACMYVCMSVYPLCFSRYRLETSCMDTSWKNSQMCMGFSGIISPCKITALWKKSWCNFVSAVSQKVFEVDSWNLRQLIGGDEQNIWWKFEKKIIMEHFRVIALFRKFGDLNLASVIYIIMRYRIETSYTDSPWKNSWQVFFCQIISP